MKCVMIVDHELPLGFIANTTAALGISLASEVEGLIGSDVMDANGRNHHGITNIPIPVLSSNAEDLKVLYDRLLENSDSDIRVIGFNDVAQKIHTYDEYIQKIKGVAKEDIGIFGMCIYGPKKKINKITGQMKMLR